MKTVILASGGTGGHIFPAEALAAELKSRGYRPVLVTDDRYDNYITSAKNLDLETCIVRSGSLGGGIFQKIKAAYAIAVGYFQARNIIKDLHPVAVVGFGGYPSFPTMYAATRMKVGTIIHEQNSMIGRANFVLSDKVDVIATSFEEVSGVGKENSHKIRFTGNPVRHAIKAIRDMEYPDWNENSILRIFVTGGSQGASIFSDVIPEAIGLLSQELRDRIRVDQQCREGTIRQVKEEYRVIGVSAELATFFHDVPSRLAASHLVIARSGASTLAEISVAGRPAIMVPYPHAMDDHQRINANAMEESGGGWVMPQEAFTPQALAARLEALLTLPATLIEAAAASRKFGRPDADKNLADLVDKISVGNVEKGGVIAEEIEGMSKLDEIETTG